MRRVALALLLVALAAPGWAQTRVVTGDVFRLSADGTAAAPAVTWASDPNMGLYRSTTDVLALVTAGTARLTVGATGAVSVGGTVTAATGTYPVALGSVAGTRRMQGAATSPTIAFLNASDVYADVGLGSLSVGGTYATTAPPANGLIVQGWVGAGTTTPVAQLTIGASGGDTVPAFGTTAVTGELWNATNASADSGLLRLSAGGTTTPGYKAGIDIQGYGATDNNQIRFYTSTAERMRLTSTGIVQPAVNHLHDLGTDALRWRTLYANELNVWRLVAKDVISTIGGEIWTSETTKLTAALGSGAGDTTLTVNDNFLEDGDFVLLKDLTSLEVLEVDSAAGGSAGVYTYTVVRDKDGSGRNAWAAGVAAVSTGKAAGEGFITQYAASAEADGLLATPLTLVGPALLGVTRTGTSWNSLAPRWVVGNLNGAYGYAANTYGLAAGDVAETWFAIDATNGFRIMHGAAEKVVIDENGDASFSGTVTATSGTIGGFTLAANTLSSGTDADYVAMSSAGTNAFWAGDSTFADAEFSVTAAGALTAVGATIKSASGTGARVELTSSGLKQYNASNVNLTTVDGTGIRVQYTTSDTWDANYLYGFNTYKGGMRLYSNEAGSRILQLLTSGTSGDSSVQLVHTDADGARVAAWLLSYASSGNIMTFTTDYNGYLGSSTLPWARVYSTAYYAGSTAGLTDTISCSASEWVNSLTVSGGIVTAGSCRSVPGLSEIAALQAQVADLQARLTALEGARR